MTSASAPLVTIVEPSRSEDLAAMRELLWDYIRDLRAMYAGTPMVAELDDEVWTRELDSLPIKYAAPAGGMLLARSGAAASGCVCVRRLDDATCEMKRLYVVPAQRGQRLAQHLVGGIIRIARNRGYARMVLDVGWRQTAALTAYRRMGCQEIPPYHPGSDWFFAHTTFFSIDLAGPVLAPDEATLQRDPA
jgi:GNAT superfamily N-acetyltransferase